MFYTKNGDDGKTSIFGCDQKLSKSSAVAEALGMLDEVNSYLGVIKSKVQNQESKALIHKIQEDLFTVQAQTAGADKKIHDEQIEMLEKTIEKIEKEIPPIKSFIISGSNEISALFDYARTLARTAERRIVAVSEEGLAKIDTNSLRYLNRLSSFLFALARHNAYKSGINEQSPRYE